MLKLEPGKLYLNSNGEVVRIVGQLRPHPERIGEFVDNNGLLYYGDGLCAITRIDNYSLTHEVKVMMSHNEMLKANVSEAYECWVVARDALAFAEKRAEAYASISGEEEEDE